MKHVFIASSEWTRIPVSLLRNFGKLGKNASALLLAVYDACQHAANLRIAASISDFSRLTGLDRRVVKRAIKRLERGEILVQIKTGVLRSRSRKPLWQINEKIYADGDEGWVPMPRLMLRYIRAYRGALILPILLQHQNMKHENYSYPGNPYLSPLLGWSPRTVYRTIEVLSDEKEWQRLETGLPRPLHVYWSPSSKVRRYRIRMVSYSGAGRNWEMRLNKEFMTELEEADRT